MIAYAISIFTSAFLVFQVQPIIARFILPWYGRAPAVWTACQLFFQLCLFGGLFLCAYIGLKRQVIVHVNLAELSFPGGTGTHVNDSNVGLVRYLCIFYRGTR